MTEAIDAATFAPIEGTDPALPGDPFTRVRYAYGQLLGAEDFTTEQKYHLLRARLRNALLHGTGVVAGLDILDIAKDDPPSAELHCTAGLAIDALGREIYVPEAICLDVTGLAANKAFWGKLAPPPAPPAPVDDGPVASCPEGGGDKSADMSADEAKARALADADPDTDGAGRRPNADSPLPVPKAPSPPPVIAPPPCAPQAKDDGVRRAYVVLSYRARLTAQTPAIAPPCSDGDDGLAWSRVLDSYRLCLEEAAPDDPFVTVRDWMRMTGADVPADPRARLQKLLTDVPPAIARLFDHVEDVKVLLAIVDLKVADDRTIIDDVDTSVRALLPPVQTIAEIMLGTRLVGPANAPSPGHFRVLSATAEANGARTAVTISFSAPPEPNSIGVDNLRVYRFAPGEGWLQPTVGDWKLDETVYTLELKEDWTTLNPPDAPPIIWQIALTGAGPMPIIDTDGHPLAGFADEPAPPSGRGRDAMRIFTFPPA